MPQSSGSLQKKLKTALNETRLLLLGGQILLGFQFHGVFQESFSELSSLARGLDAVALLLMVTTLGLLIAPSMQHRIVEEGRTSQRIFRVTGYMAGAALLPFAISNVAAASLSGPRCLDPNAPSPMTASAARPKWSPRSAS